MTIGFSSGFTRERRWLRRALVLEGVCVSIALSCVILWNSIPRSILLVTSAGGVGAVGLPALYLFGRHRHDLPFSKGRSLA